MNAAIRADDLPLVTQILAAGYDPAADLGEGLNALHVAASGDHATLVPVLVAAGVPLEGRATGLTPLLWAAESGSGATVTALLHAGADVTAISPTLNAGPLHLAARYNNVEAIEALLTAGVDIDGLDDAGGTPLIFAAYYGAYDAADYLIGAGADLTATKHGSTALAWAVSKGHPEIAQLLMDAGAPG